jgi:hypothetical protein
MFTGTIARDPGIVNLPVGVTTIADANGNLVPTVKRGQCVKLLAGVAVPVTDVTDGVIGYALSDADQRDLVVPVYVSTVTVEMLVATGVTIAQGDILYSTGDGTVTNVQPGSNVAIGIAVNPSYGQRIVEMGVLRAGHQ